MLKNRKRRKKIKKTFEILVLISFISWTSIFLIDYYRANKEQKPIITIKKVTTSCPNGNISEYYGLGYVYRDYKCSNLEEITFQPFWTKRKEIPKEDASQYPDLSTKYEIYDNPNHQSKIKDILYFYENDELIYTYKCQNSQEGCNVATSVKDNFNQRYSQLPMAKYNNYVFIDDSSANERIIYIVDTTKNEIVYQVKDIVAATKNNDEGLGIKDKYIVINSQNKYGIISLEEEVKISTPYNYDYIKYNTQSNTYTVKSKYWMITNFDENLYVSNTQLVDAYYINEKLYIKIVKEKKIDDQTIYTYNILDTEHTPLLVDEAYGLENINDKFITINNFLEIEIYDLNNQKINIEPITVHINPLKINSAAFWVEDNETSFTLFIPYPEENKVDKYTFDSTTYKLIKKEINVSIS